MTATVATTGASATAAVLSAAVTELIDLPLSPLGESELLDLMRSTERARRQLEHLDQLLIAEVEARAVPARYVLRGTSYFLSAPLNLSPAESTARTRRSHELAPR